MNMKNNTQNAVETPRTESEKYNVEYTSGLCEVVDAEFSRTLERELLTAAKQLEVVTKERDLASRNYSEYYFLWKEINETLKASRRVEFNLQQQLEALQKENEELKDLNKTLHGLMVSGEKRGVDKGHQERDSLKSQVEELKVRNYALDGAMQDWQDISDSLKSALKMCADSLVRIKLIAQHRVAGADSLSIYDTVCNALSDPRVQQVLEGK